MSAAAQRKIPRPLAGAAMFGDRRFGLRVISRVL